MFGHNPCSLDKLHDNSNIPWDMMGENRKYTIVEEMREEGEVRSKEDWTELYSSLPTKQPLDY